MFNKLLTTGASAIALAAIALPATAQDYVIEEIVVTAAKRQQTLQEVPVAVSVVSAADFKESQVQDIKDLQFLVPSLKITQLQSSGNTNFIIRGFGNGANNAGIEPSVGVFIDGVYRSRSAAALNDLPNIERIEVLRGPQSTLFGKNASAGVISVITGKPSLEETTGSASLTFGDYSQVIVKGDVNGPLSDTVGFSLSGSFNQRDGYYDNLAGGDALGELDRFGVRGQLYFEPSDTLDFRIIADYSELDEACCGVANLSTGPTTPAILLAGGNLVPASPFAYQGFYDFTPRNEFESSGISVQFNLDVTDSITLTSITAIRNLERLENGDVDFTSAALIDPDVGNLTDAEIDTVTQEFRLAGGTDKATWMIGAFLFDEDITQNTGLVYGDGFRPYADALTTGLTGGNPLTDPSPLDAIEGGLTALGFPVATPPGTFFGAGQGLFEVSTMDNQAISIFAQVDLDLSDSTTLTLGANFTDDEKDVTFDSTNTDVFSQLSLEQVGGALIYGGVLQAELMAGTDPVTADAIATATAAALAPVPCSAANPPPACNSTLALAGFQFLPPNVDYPNAIETGNTQDDDVTWTVRLAHDLTDNVNVYVSAGTGFKASSWNLSRDSRPFAGDLAAIQAANPGVNNLVAGTRFATPEESTVYELGLKGAWDNVTMNVAIFEQELEDFQSNIFNGTGFNLANSEKRSTSGAEFDIRWVPTEVFEATLGATFLDSKYDVFTGATGPNNTVVDYINADVPGVPDLSLTATGRFSFNVGNAAGFARLEYIYEDSTQVIENVPASLATREINTLNASVGLSWDNGFEAMLWGRNVTNDEYLLSAFPSVAQNVPPGAYSGYPNQPRTFGLTVRKYFD